MNLVRDDPDTYWQINTTKVLPRVSSCQVRTSIYGTTQLFSKEFAFLPLLSTVLVVVDLKKVLYRYKFKSKIAFYILRMCAVYVTVKAGSNMIYDFVIGKEGRVLPKKCSGLGRFFRMLLVSLVNEYCVPS